MRASSVLWAGPKAPFASYGKKFDTLFVQPKKAKKAWDGQDKDAFFRDKYAHVHAKQLEIRKKEQQLKKERLARQPRRPVESEVDVVNFVPVNNLNAKLQKDLLKHKDVENIFGRSPVLAALEKRNPLKLYTGYRKQEMDSQILKACMDLRVPIVTGLKAIDLNLLSKNGVHNNYVLAAHKRELPAVTDLDIESGNLLVVGKEQPIKRTHPLGIYIDEVTDTHNMGAIMRSAYWFGVDFVAFSRRNCAPLSPQVLKASAAAAEYLNIYEVPQPLKFFENLKEKNWNIIATVVPGTKTKLERRQANELNSMLQDGPCLLVIGSEGEGLRTTLLQRSTDCVSLESQHDSSMIDSLNVSVATALLLSSLTNDAK